MNGTTLKVVGGIALTLLSALGIYDIHERRETNRKIGMSMRELKEAEAKNISAAMVEKAVGEAAKSSVEHYMNGVEKVVLEEARIKLRTATEDAVKKSADQIQKEVGEKISSEVSLIDISEMKKSAREKAEEKILNKFDGNLEDLLSKFNDNLSNIQKIYGGIADAISKGNERDKGVKFTIG